MSYAEFDVEFIVDKCIVGNTDSSNVEIGGAFSKDRNEQVRGYFRKAVSNQAREKLLRHLPWANSSAQNSKQKDISTNLKRGIMLKSPRMVHKQDVATNILTNTEIHTNMEMERDFCYK